MVWEVRGHVGLRTMSKQLTLATSCSFLSAFNSLQLFSRFATLFEVSNSTVCNYFRGLQLFSKFRQNQKLPTPPRSSLDQNLARSASSQKAQNPDHQVAAPFEADVCVVVASTPLASTPNDLPVEDSLRRCAAASREQRIDFGYISFLFRI